MSLGSKLKSKWLWLVGVVLVVIGFAFSQMAGGIEAETYVVSRGEIAQTVEDTGEVLSQNKQTVYLEGAGLITAIKVDVGDSVKQGDLLLSLDKTELELQLKDAEAKLKGAQAQLAGTASGNYRKEIELAEARLSQAKTTFDSAERDFDLAKTLFAAQAISEIELNKAEDAYKLAQASLEAAILQLQDIQEGTPDYIIKGYESQLEQAKLAWDAILEKMAKQDLKSPVTGVILERLVDVNTPVAPGTSAFIIGSVSDLEIEAEILADEIYQVQEGNQVEITGKAIGDQVLFGQVVKIAPAAKTVTSGLGVNQKRVPVTIALSEQAGLLKPGFNVDVKIITAKKDNALLVPDTAVFDYQGKSQVFVVENGKALLREVEAGLESDSFIEILDGLKEGELILAKPDTNVGEGAKIKPIMKNGSDTTVQ